MTKQQREELRRQKTSELYLFMRQEAQGGISIGLDEVGRGALAGPLAVGAVALPDEPQIIGLDDSKKLTPKRREELAELIKEQALAWAVAYVLAQDIDAYGMAACLRVAFKKALEDCVEKLGAQPQAVLIDGMPLHIHPNERCIVKGDGKCACIAAASIVAKVARDRLMSAKAAEFPVYGFESNKGYGSAAHIEAIREYGPSMLHRRSFLGNVLAEQQTIL